MVPFDLFIGRFDPESGYTTLSSRSLGLTVMLLFELEVELQFEFEELLEAKACR